MVSALLNARAAEISLGTVAVLPGNSVTLPLFVQNAPTNLSAFAVWLTNAPGFATPTASASPAQPNLTVFVDPRSNGVIRVTGLILSGPPITNGHVASLHYTAPVEITAGAYPVLVAGAVSPNPEFRSLVANELLTASGAGGLILVPGEPPRLIDLIRTNSTFQFAFDGTWGTNQTVLATTNFTDWSAIGSATMIAPGRFQFTDPDADQFPFRFYRLKIP